MAAEGLITFEELRSKLEEAEQTREKAQRALKALNRHQEKIKELERNKDAVTEYYVGLEHRPLRKKGYRKEHTPEESPRGLTVNS